MKKHTSHRNLALFLVISFLWMTTQSFSSNSSGHAGDRLENILSTTDRETVSQVCPSIGTRMAAGTNFLAICQDRLKPTQKYCLSRDSVENLGIFTGHWLISWRDPWGRTFSSGSMISKRRFWYWSEQQNTLEFELERSLIRAQTPENPSKDPTTKTVHDSKIEFDPKNGRLKYFGSHPMQIETHKPHQLFLQCENIYMGDLKR